DEIHNKNTQIPLKKRMPNLLGKNLHLCFSPLKRPQLTEKAPPKDPNRPSATSSTSTSTTATFFNNYTTVCDPLPPNSHADDLSFSTSSSYTNAINDHIAAPGAIPDFAALHSSNRFFISSPGRSNSIVDSSSSSSSLLHSLHENDPQVTGAGTMAVQTDSLDPYSDFRRSMVAMMEARDLDDVRSNWEYLHELLLCHLSLNQKDTHKFIIRAFADLLVSLLAADDVGRHG
ncbi:hypothetical protein Dimus_036380, partial [Dionaea muscipula]